MKDVPKVQKSFYNTHILLTFYSIFAIIGILMCGNDMPRN